MTSNGERIPLLSDSTEYRNEGTQFFSRRDVRASRPSNEEQNPHT
jgi:hypothetical protein